jgi:hypothetical protein
MPQCLMLLDHLSMNATQCCSLQSRRSPGQAGMLATATVLWQCTGGQAQHQWPHTVRRWPHCNSVLGLTASIA